ncbi:MAG TPA: hypothetical protein VF808_04095 [Ktedonobacterales bacterium]
MVAPSGKGIRRKAAPVVDTPTREPGRGRVSGAGDRSGARDRSGPRRGVAELESQPKSRPSRTAFLLISTALAIALIGIGVASYFAANLLGGAVRAAARRGAETPSALAATVCADFLHQNYDDLLARVDPNPAAPAATGAFDAGAVSQRLRAMDQRDGPVSYCSPTRLDASQVDPTNGPDGATRLLLVMWRVGVPNASVLVTRLGPDGAWLVERDSAFLLAS